MSSVSGKKLLIIAIACGLLAAFLGWAYLKAKESQYKAAYQPAIQVMASVVVPKEDIGKAQTLSRENVAAMEVPREYLPSNVILAEDWPRVENRMVVTPLQRGRPITWDAVESASVSRLSENVELGKRLKTVQINKINSFDGMLRPGDRIDLLGSFSAKDVGVQEQPNYSDQVVMTVLENVEVLAAGREDAHGRKYEKLYDRNSADGFNMNFSTLSLMLTPAQVARVELAEKAGELVAVLRHPKDDSAEPLGQVTVASLLDPLPAETVDVVVDAEGRLLGRIVGDNVVDAKGRIIGRIIEGQAIGNDGKVMGRIIRGLAADDPLLRMHERATVVRDADGNVIGKVVDGKVVDAHGNVIGSYQDGKAIALDGSELGRVEQNVALDASGRVIDMSRSQLQGADANVSRIVDGKVVDAQGNVIAQTGEIVRDANGNVLGRVVDGKLVDADGKVIGTIKDGVAVSNDGKVLGKIEQAVLGSDGTPLPDSVMVVRDANGNPIGTVVGNDIIDAQGRKVGTVRDGQAFGLDGKPMTDAQISVQKDAQQVVRDASGNIIGNVRGDTVYDADGKAVGKLVDGKLVDRTGNVIARGLSVGLETPQSAAAAPRRATARTIQFIPGGTGRQGVLPVQTLRLE